jgi:ribosomal protein S1
LYKDGIEVVIPRIELSWDVLSPPRDDQLLNTTQRITILERIDESRSLTGSIRSLTDDPWPEIHKKLPKGTELRATVAEVTPHFVRVNLPGGLQGIIPKEAMIDAGYEYKDFVINVVPGQGLDVVVTKVFLEKRKIRLNLKRNLPRR